MSVLRALAAQVVMLLLLFVLAQLGLHLSGWQFLLAQGVGAALLGQCFRLAFWWWPINALFVPGLYAAQSVRVDGYWALLGFALLLAVFWNSVYGRVPLYLSDRRVRLRMQQWLAERRAGARFVDLGCGVGSMICPLARALPHVQFVGVETAPFSFCVAWLRSLPLANCQVRYRSLWRQPLQDFDVVYCFLSPEPMPALWEKACTQMRAGSYLISNSFAVPGHEAHAQWQLGGWRDARVYLWRMQADLAVATVDG